MVKGISRLNCKQIISPFIVTCLLFHLNVSLSLAQNQKSWQWVKQIGSKSWDKNAGIICSAENDLFIGGTFSDTLILKDYKISSNGLQDILLAKYNTNGKLKSVLSFGGKGSDNLLALSIHQSENVLLAGQLTDTVKFEKELIPSSGKNLFIALLSKGEKMRWIRTIKPLGEAYLSTVTSDKYGNIYAAGYFSDSLLLSGSTLYVEGEPDIFVVKYDKDGNLLFFNKIGTDAEETLQAFAVSDSGNIALSFKIRSVITANSLNNSIKEVIENKLIVLNPDFSVRTQHLFTASDYYMVSAMRYDNNSNLFITGSFNLKVGIADTVLVSNGRTDGFLIKINPSGSIDWIRNFGSRHNDNSYHLNINPLGDVVLTGDIGGAMTIDSVRISNKGIYGFSIAIQFSQSGEAIWGDGFSGEGINSSEGSVIDKDGNLYISGSFRNSLGNKQISLNSYGDQDIFIAKFINCNPPENIITGDLHLCPGAFTYLSVGKGFSDIVWLDSINRVSKIRATSKGQYWVSMIDKKGCRISDTVYVDDNLPTRFSLGNDTLISANDSLILFAPETHHDYQWSDNSVGPSLTVNSLYLKQNEALVWLKVRDSNECLVTDTILIKLNGNINHDKTSAPDLFVYPNPTDGRLKWLLTSENSGNLDIRVTDPGGKTLYHNRVKNIKYNQWQELNLRSIPSGTYSFIIRDLTKHVVFKPVKLIKY